MNKDKVDNIINSDADGDEVEISKLIAEIEKIRVRLNDVIRQLADTRGEYYTTGQRPELRERLTALEEEAKTLTAESTRLTDQLQKLAGIPDELLEAIEEESLKGDDHDRLFRRQLTRDEIASTENCEDLIGPALDAIYGVVSKEWLEMERSKAYRLGDDFLNSSFSLFRGVRVESEYPISHRFAQAIFVSEDFLNGHAEYDFMAGALLVPQTIQLGLSLDLLRKVKGADDRIRSLWMLPSERSESTTYELLVAVACAEHGRDVEFLPATSGPSPDLKVNDYPFPTFVECKRKRPFSEFEFEEEKHARIIFEALKESASKIGLWGAFALSLDVEPETAPVQEIVDCALRQRFSYSPNQRTDYPWGHISYRELPPKINCPLTRVYSPLFLQNLFNWNADLPDHDGIICKVKAPKYIWIDTAEEPVALLWRVTTARAIKKRSWTVKSLYTEAVQQIPAGGVGIFYLCHQEGARDQIADLRLNEFVLSISSMEHSPAIRLPIFFMTRLYPRALNHGSPDLIENGVQFLSSYADPVYFRDFPTTVFTRVH